MQTQAKSGAARRLVRLALLGAGMLLLAGCATGYRFVQPGGAGSGGYYTSAAPYSGQGYYDDYGTGPYYAGTSGWGYYNGTYPYSYPYGYSGGYYGGTGYWPSFTFNLGISNVWNFPGYWGPWYSSGYPLWGCSSWNCGGWHHHHGHAGTSGAPQPMLKPDTPDFRPIPGTIARNGAPPVAMPSRPAEGIANRRPLESARYAPHDFPRPLSRPSREPGFGAMPTRVAEVPRVPVDPEFANRGAQPMPTPMAQPRGFQPTPRPVFRAPAPAAAPVAPPSRNRATRTERQ